MTKSVRAPVVMVGKEDKDNNGQYESWDISFNVPIAATESVYGVQLALFFDTKLNGQSLLDMDSMIYVDYTNVTFKAIYS